MLLHNWKNDLLLTRLLEEREARLHSEEHHWRWLLFGAPDLGFPVQPGEKLHLQSPFWRVSMHNNKLKGLGIHYSFFKKRFING